jgi:Uma2 family endonuclease
MSTVATFSLEQYERMAEAGAFDGEFHQRVELIHGEIREMNPIGSPHAQTVTDLTDWSYEAIPRGQIAIRVQSPLRIPQLNCAPEPDLAWVKRKKYRRRHPEPADVLLLIEVAESSVSFERGEKRDIYAKAAIPDYWIVNLVNRTIEVYRQSDGESFQWSKVFGVEDVISPLALPEASLVVGSLFVA